jgi:4-amino-4-deoxy-L-arabinose transferase-like glycosyltransferase
MADLSRWVFDKRRFMLRCTVIMAIAWFVLIFVGMEMPAEFLLSWYAVGLALLAACVGYLYSLGMWRYYMKPKRDLIESQLAHAQNRQARHFGG